MQGKNGMKVVTQDQKLELIPAKNGWLLCLSEWDRDKNHWDEKERFVYQDFDVMMEILKEILSG